LRSYGASNLPNFRILAFVGDTCAPPSVLLVLRFEFDVDNLPTRAFCY